MSFELTPSGGGISISCSLLSGERWKNKLWGGGWNSGKIWENWLGRFDVGMATQCLSRPRC